MIIAVDFDGTIVRDCYPDIGKERTFAVQTLKAIMAEGHQVILWTVREGDLLREALEWCRKHGLEFYAVNKNYPEEKDDDKFFSRKLRADMFIDDRNVGGLPDWGVLYEMIHKHKTLEQIILEQAGEWHHSRHKKKPWWKF